MFLSGKKIDGKGRDNITIINTKQPYNDYC